MESNNQISGTGIKDSETIPSLETETRFAVVMYGGISLAIYIHGVAQELYHMVRATARRVDDDSHYFLAWKQLTSGEKVYRKLGEALRTKFVVDILSGTSAGGINAVYLAKALVNDQQNRSMESIKDFWVQQGDIGVLINDKESLNSLGGLTLQNPPAGLLNSQRFYYKLLEALKKMGSSKKDVQSPYVEELDLNITTTDIRGLNLPLKINNDGAVVSESRFKYVFKFNYGKNYRLSNGEIKLDTYRNDFAKKFDPFLAFAARCTASIPPAFEAMQLEDIIPILKTDLFKDDYKDISVNDTDWKQFYKEYLDRGDDFPLRSFGDGGYLDNKPFSYATEALLSRRADFPVDRKLIYIEPSPEHPEDKPLTTERPDMLENILAALVGLPRQETIREDLKVIAERNKLIRNVKHILSESFYFKNNKGDSAEPKWVHKLEWANKFLLDQDVLTWYGNGYITYHQLRVESVLKDLSMAFSEALGWSVNGSEENKLHELLHTWLDELYSTCDTEKISQNDILFRLDLSFRMRKHHFIQHILNTILLHLGKYLHLEEVDIDPDRKDEAIADRKMKEYEHGKKEIENIFDTSDQAFADKMAGKVGEKEIEICLILLRGLKREINNVYSYMRARDWAMRMQTPILDMDDRDPDLDAYRLELGKLKDYLIDENDKVIPTDLIEKLTITLGTHVYIPSRGRKPSGYLYTTFHKVTEMVKEIGIVRTQHDMEGSFKEMLTKECPAYLKELEETLQKDHLSSLEDVPGYKLCLKIYQHVQKCLAYYYENFEYYDMLTFPIQYGTDAGESDEVEIIRISPEDAKILVDERNSGRHKLSGTKLANFGAFFNDEWRQNDILWGRLDAAEILIKELLKNYPLVDSFLRSKLMEILKEPPAADNDLRSKLMEILKEPPAGDSGLHSKLMKSMNESRAPGKDLHSKLTNILDEYPADEYGLHSTLLGLYDEEFAVTEKKRSEKFTKDNNFPYNLLFQFILEEDLRPRDKSILYSFLDGEFETQDHSTVEPDKSKPVITPHLRKILDREKSLKQLEDDLYLMMRKNIGPNPDPLRKQIIEQFTQAVIQEKKGLASDKEKIIAQQGKKGTDGQVAYGRMNNFKSKLISLPTDIMNAAQTSLEKLQKKNGYRFKDVMRSLTSDKHEILDYFKYGYEVNTEFETETTIKLADRGARAFSRLLGGLAQKYPIQKPVGILTVILQVISTLVNFALPKTLGNFIFENYWVGLVYAAELIVLVMGIIGRHPTVIDTAKTLIIVTVAIHFTVIMLNEWISKRKRYIWYFQALVFLVWLFGIYTNTDIVAEIGFFTFLITLAISVMVYTVNNDSNPWVRGFKWFFGAVLAISLMGIFYLGLVYLDAMPPVTGKFVVFLEAIKGIFSK